MRCLVASELTLHAVSVQGFGLECDLETTRRRPGRFHAHPQEPTGSGRCALAATVWQRRVTLGKCLLEDPKALFFVDKLFVCGASPLSNFVPPCSEWDTYKKP